MRVSAGPPRRVNLPVRTRAQGEVRADRARTARRRGAPRARRHAPAGCSGSAPTRTARRGARGPRTPPRRSASRTGRYPVADLPLAHEVVQRVEGLGDRGRRIGRVQLVEVDPVRLQAGEGCLDRTSHVRPRPFRSGLDARGEPAVAELRGEHEAVAAPAQRLSHERLRQPGRLAVDVRGVEERDAGVGRGVEHSARALQGLGRRSGTAEVVAAESDGGDEQSGGAHTTQGHGVIHAPTLLPGAAGRLPRPAARAQGLGCSSVGGSSADGAADGGVP